MDRFTYNRSLIQVLPHQLFVLSATSAALAVQDRFEHAVPGDERPRRAIDAALAWVRGAYAHRHSRGYPEANEDLRARIEGAWAANRDAMTQTQAVRDAAVAAAKAGESALYFRYSADDAFYAAEAAADDFFALERHLQRTLPRPTRKVEWRPHWFRTGGSDWLLVDGQVLCKLGSEGATEQAWAIEDPKSWETMPPEAQVAMDVGLNG